MGTLDSKVAIITGCTAASIGRACAMAMAMEGAKIIVTGRTKKGGLETERIIRKAGGEALYVRQDVTVEDDWKNTIDICIKTYGRLDILLNNAGEAIVGPLEKLTRENLIFLRQVDLDAPFLGMKYAWPHLVSAGSGVILNMSSIIGQKGRPFGTAYGAIKGAQLALTRTAALEGAPFNIRAISVHPGMIWTEGVYDVMGPKADDMKPEIAGRIPWGETGEPQHVGATVAFLCSEEASYLTGIEVNIDGGAGAI